MLQSVASKTMGPVAWVMPILIAVTACSSFNSGTMVGSRYLHVAYTHVHLATENAGVETWHQIAGVVSESDFLLTYCQLFRTDCEWLILRATVFVLCRCLVPQCSASFYSASASA